MNNNNMCTCVKPKTLGKIWEERYLSDLKKPKKEIINLLKTEFEKAIMRDGGYCYKIEDIRIAMSVEKISNISELLDKYHDYFMENEGIDVEFMFLHRDRNTIDLECSISRLKGG